MPDVKTNAILPRGDDNGLAPVAAQLADEATGRAPKQLRAVLGIVDCRRVAVDADTGDEVATVRFRRVELLLPGDLPEAEKLIRRALEARSGQTTLPLELEDEIRQAFADMAPDDEDDGDGAFDADGDDPKDGSNDDD